MAVLAYRGDLRHLACDAWYLPGDFEPYIAEYWLDGDRDLEQAVAAAEHHLPENWNSGGTRVVPLRLTDTRRATPILAAIPNRGTSTWSYHRETLRQFTELAATLPRPKHMERRPRRLFRRPADRHGSQFVAGRQGEARPGAPGRADRRVE